MDAGVSDSKLESIDIQRIMELIPHRYPFLLVDRLVDIVPEQSCTGIKNVTVNEPHFAGHFPGRPVMPGVLIIEALAQTAGILVVHSTADSKTPHMVYFLSVDSCRFRKPVEPGDRLKLHVERLQRRGNVWRFKGEARVEGQLVAEATFAAMMTDGE